MTELLLLSESSKNTCILENLSNINLKVFLGFHIADVATVLEEKSRMGRLFPIFTRLRSLRMQSHDL